MTTSASGLRGAVISAVPLGPAHAQPSRKIAERIEGWAFTTVKTELDKLVAEGVLLRSQEPLGAGPGFRHLYYRKGT